jgi:hypothetical protein
MARLIEIQDLQNVKHVPEPLALHVDDILMFRATGGRIRANADVVELLGPFVPGVIGTNGEILSPIGAPNRVMFRACHPGLVTVEVITGDPWHIVQTITLNLVVEP